MNIKHFVKFSSMKTVLSTFMLLALVSFFTFNPEPKQVLVFFIGDFSGMTEGVVFAQASLGGQSTVTQNSSASSGLVGPETCTGKNYNTGGTYTEPSPKANGRGFCPGVYNCNPIVPETCVNPVTGETMPDGYTCRVGVYATGTGGPAIRALPLNILDCARQGLEWRFTQPAGGRRMPNVGTSFMDNGCYMEYDFTHPANGYGRPNMICGTLAGSGTEEDGVETGSSDRENEGAAIRSQISGNLGTSSGTGTNQVFAPYGFIEVADGVVKGWALDTSNLTKSLSVRAYIDDKFIGEYPANQSRNDLSATFGLPATAGTGNHGFSFALPSGSSGTLTVYAVNPTGGGNPELDDKVIGSSVESAPSSYIPRTVATSGTGQQASNGVVDNSCAMFGCSELGMLEQQTSVGQQQAMCQYAYGVLGTPTFDRCKVDPGDGGNSCDIPTRGSPAQRDLWQLCADRFEACYANPDASGKNWVTWGFCDPVKYAYCREAEIFENPGSGVLDQAACNRMLLDGGCQDNPQGCDIKGILGI